MASKERQIERWAKLTLPVPKELKCIICDNIDIYDNYKKIYATDIFCAGTLIRHQCPNCDLIFGDLRFFNLTEEEIQKDHDDTYSYFTEGENTSCQLNSLLSLSIDIMKNKNLKFLDYACGSFKMYNVLKKKGINITGYDKYVSGPNTLNNIDGLKFDIIYSNNFIEHLTDPIKQISEILNYLNYDGYLIFISDCIDEYKIEYTHFHLYYYLGKSFQLLCDKLNLKIIESNTIESCRIKVLQKKY
jgi:SAM-dependent methyltransferase